MAENEQKAARYVAVGYIALSLMWFAIPAALVDISGWNEFIQVMRGGGDLRNILLVTFGVGLLNLVLALGAWKIFSLPQGLQYALLFVCIAIPACLLVSDVAALLIIHFEGSALHPDATEISSAIVLASVYGLQAWMIVRAARMAHAE